MTNNWEDKVINTHSLLLRTVDSRLDLYFLASYHLYYWEEL